MLLGVVMAELEGDATVSSCPGEGPSLSENCCELSSKSDSRWESDWDMNGWVAIVSCESR
jgi:hypothetical protein